MHEYRTTWPKHAAGCPRANAPRTRTSFSPFPTFVFAATLCLSAAVFAGTVIRVKHGAPGPGDGQTWETAYPSLNHALDAAAASEGSTTEIWVAAGMYTPDPSGLDDPHHATFTLVPGVSLYGGFAGKETSRDERSPNGHNTTLSGDLNHDDGTNFFRYEDNVAHVVTAIGVSGDTILDRFTISGGSAVMEGASGGGGIVLDGDLVLRQCSVCRNQAGTTRDGGGGGIAIWGGHPVIFDCQFVGNRSNGAGGAVWAVGEGSLEIRSCVLYQNSANQGGAIHMSNSEVLIASSKLSENTSELEGGALYAENLDGLTMSECVFQENNSKYGGAGLITYSRGVWIDGCSFHRNTAIVGGGLIIDDMRESAVIAGSSFTNNYAGFGAGVFLSRFRTAHAIVTDTEFQSNGWAIQGGALYVENAPLRAIGLLLIHNLADAGGGIYLYGGASSLVLESSVLRHNGAFDGAGVLLRDHNTALISHCRVAANRALNAGGGILMIGGETDISNTLLVANEAAVGGGIHHADGALTAANVTVYGNVASVVGAGILGGYDARVANSILWGNYRIDEQSDTYSEDDQVLGLDRENINFSIVHDWTGSRGGYGNSGADPMFVHPLGPDGYLGTEDDDFRLQANSPAINAGDPTLGWTPGEADLDGRRRVLCGRVDMGAYEFGIGDFDCDGRVDIFDFTKWSACALGPDVNVEGEACGAYDFDADGNIDLRDFAGLARTIEE